MPEKCSIFQHWRKQRNHFYLMYTVAFAANTTILQYCTGQSGFSVQLASLNVLQDNQFWPCECMGCVPILQRIYNFVCWAGSVICLDCYFSSPTNHLFRLCKLKGTCRARDPNDIGLCWHFGGAPPIPATRKVFRVEKRISVSVYRM